MATLINDWEKYLKPLAGKTVEISDRYKTYRVTIPIEMPSLESGFLRCGTYENGYQTQVLVGTFGGDSEDEWRSKKTYSTYINISEFEFAKIV